MTSPTPETPRRALPRALFIAACMIGVVELGLTHFRMSFINDQWITYETKRLWAEGAREGDVVLLGDSGIIAGLRPKWIEPALPPGTRVLNLGVSASGPSGGQVLLREYLANHPPPQRVVLSFSPITLMDEPPQRFVDYVLVHLLGPGDAVRAAVAERRPLQILDWIASRISSYRYRTDLLSGGASLVLDARPDLLPYVYDALGMLLKPFYQARIRWGFTERAKRNRLVQEDFEREAGWRYFEEYARPGGILPDGYAFDQKPFEPSRRELLAMHGMLTALEEKGVPVLVVPSALPRERIEQLERNGGGKRLAGFWATLRTAHPTMVETSPLVIPMENRFFSDDRHLNPAGARRYSAFVTQVLSRLERNSGR